MNVPFTVDEFLAAVQHYNLAVWPAQGIAYALGVLMIGLAIRPAPWAGRVIGAILSLLWLWVGIVYFLLNCQSMTSGSFWFGLAFVAQGVLTAIFITIRREFGFRFKADGYGITGALFILYAMLAYPVLGPLFGHNYPAVPVFGVSPDTLTIFTFGLWLWADVPVPRYLLMLPFVWAMIGSVIALAMGLPEDGGLFIAGLIGSLMVLRRERVETAAKLKAAKSGR